MIAKYLKLLGPGFAVAATGVGAGDLVAASVAGAKYGTVILWAAIFGALIKFALNEGVSRWQLATGTSILEGWVSKFHPVVSWYFMVYLVLWSFIVAAALASACGLAGHALYDGLSVPAWAAIHSVIAFLLVYFGRYNFFETLMKIFIGMMFVTVLACAWMVDPEWSEILPALVVPALPDGSAKFLLGILWGVGGSVTLLSYGYWIREKGWKGKEYVEATRIDLGTAYLFTGLFAAAMMIVAAEVSPTLVTGDRMALEVANRIGELIGTTGKWTFLIGFWGAVFTSMLGVWQGVPYLFADFASIRREKRGKSPLPLDNSSLHYKVFLAYLAFPPLLLLLFGRPVWVVVTYAIIGAFFMPFLAGTALIMNNRRDWVGELKNGWLMNGLLVVSLAVFGYLCFVELGDVIR
jgi:Mn2+/Fe2+ NRAMP family transporter